MCLIVYKPEGKEFEDTLVRRAAYANDDGFGIMYACGDPNCKKVHHYKTMGGIKSILDLYEKHRDKELAMHFRLATHGAHDVRNAHPYPVLTVKDHGIDVYMMHNGIMSFVDLKDKNMSDSYNFAKYWLRPMLAHDHTILYEEAFQKAVSRIIGSGNKLVFLDGTGKYTFINQNEGEEHESGCWVSNTYSLWPVKRYYYSGGSSYTGWDDADIEAMIDEYGISPAEARSWKRAEAGSFLGQGIVNTSGASDVKLLPPPAKSAEESANAMRELGMLDSEATPVGVGNELAQREVEALVRQQLESEGAESDEIEDTLDGIRARLNSITWKELEEEDLHGLEWFKIYELIENHPEKVTDFLFQKFA